MSSDSEGNSAATVLVVDDEAGLVELYASWLGAEYEVQTAQSGEEALEEFGADTDVVLLDRRMPGYSGDEVLEAIREGDHEARVAMVTAVDPDFDVVEMGFDDYLVKPVGREEVHDVVEKLLDRRTYDEQVQELLALTEKKAKLEAHHPPEELRSDERYERLDERIRSQMTDARETLTALFESDRASADVFRTLLDAPEDPVAGEGGDRLDDGLE
jgi:DNA-binding response OmpR family regulator